VEEQVKRAFFYAHWPDEVKDAARARDCICGKCHHCGKRTFAGYLLIFDELLKLFADIPEAEQLLACIAVLQKQVEVIQNLYERDVPPEDLDQMLEMFSYNQVSNQAEQGQLHALQGVKEVLRVHKLANLHITEAVLWTDGAHDYAATTFMGGMLVADTMIATGGIKVIAHSHSIPGEGKAANDMRNGLMSMGLTRSRERGERGGALHVESS
jgi:hypothetical protein